MGSPSVQAWIHQDITIFTEGFGAEPRPGDWSLFDRHIAQNIANGDEEVAQYILNWIAHLFQYPGGRRPGTAIVLRGKQWYRQGRLR